MINWTLRWPSHDGAQRTLDLLVRCDISEYGEPDTDLEGLLFECDQIDRKCDACLALTPQDRLVGYGAILPWGEGFRYDEQTKPRFPAMGHLPKMLVLAPTRKRGPALYWSTPLRTARGAKSPVAIRP